MKEAEGKAKKMKSPRITKRAIEEARKASALFGRIGGEIGGLSKSEAKTSAARENGKLGGRPAKCSDCGASGGFHQKDCKLRTDTLAIENANSDAIAKLVAKHMEDWTILSTSDFQSVIEVSARKLVAKDDVDPVVSIVIRKIEEKIDRRGGTL